MRLFISFLLLIISGVLGYLFSQRLVKKRVFYETMREFNKTFKSEVLFSQNSITSIIEKNDECDDFYKLLKYNLKIISSVPIVGYLNKDELKYIKNYSSSLCNGNIDTLIKYLNENDATITSYLNESRENELKYKTLYIKLGVLGGLILFILLL